MWPIVANRKIVRYAALVLRVRCRNARSRDCQLIYSRAVSRILVPANNNLNAVTVRMFIYNAFV